MHRLPSRQAIRRFKIAAVLLWLNALILLTAVVMLGVAVIMHDQEPVRVAIILFAIFIPASITQWIIAQQTKCPLCITPPLANKDCSKNKNAKTLLGSYRFRVSASILLRNHFRCPYCNEPTVLEVRKKGGSGKYSRG